MRSTVFTVLSGVAMLGFAVPALAHPNDSHQDQHEQINEQHADVHDQVDAIHEDAHEQGISRYEDQQLHRQLERAHARADGNLEAQHYYQHQNDRYGYGGYNNGYGNGYNNGGYGAPDLSFTCKVDYSGRVIDLQIDRNRRGYNRGYRGY